MDDLFAQLEAEIATITKATKLKADREAAKKRANNMHSPQAARAKAKAEFQALDFELQASEWTAVKTIALFHEQTCDGCDSVHHTFLQYMELHQLIRKPTTQRWQRVTKPQDGLPRESLVQPMVTHICAHCAEEHGFALIDGKRLKPRKEAFAPSIEYAQEDINATTAEA